MIESAIELSKSVELDKIEHKLNELKNFRREGDERAMFFIPSLEGFPPTRTTLEDENPDEFELMPLGERIHYHTFTTKPNKIAILDFDGTITDGTSPPTILALANAADGLDSLEATEAQKHGRMIKVLYKLYQNDSNYLGEATRGKRIVDDGGVQNLLSMANQKLWRNAMNTFHRLVSVFPEALELAVEAPFRIRDGIRELMAQHGKNTIISAGITEVIWSFLIKNNLVQHNGEQNNIEVYANSIDLDKQLREIEATADNPTFVTAFNKLGPMIDATRQTLERDEDGPRRRMAQQFRSLSNNFDEQVGNPYTSAIFIGDSMEDVQSASIVQGINKINIWIVPDVDERNKDKEFDEVIKRYRGLEIWRKGTPFDILVNADMGLEIIAKLFDPNVESLFG